MSVTQNVWDYIELSKITKVPVLLISNPGYGKTTGIVSWANKNGYAYEQLIGSRFSPDDIMGYQVNEKGSNTLVQKDPVWFQRIIDNKAKGTPTILFCDEISTCSDAVQGSLLSLIFDRRIGNGKELPEDCIVLAAANYSQNLPSFMNIMAPTINRFCIVNLLKGYNNSELTTECLTAQTPVLRNLREVDEDKIITGYKEIINSVIMKYSNVNATLGYIDLQNHDISNIYKRKGNVYNIMSWRSITYLKELVLGMAKLGIYEENIINNICGGMIGLGSNNFKTEDQIETFISFVTEQILLLVKGSGVSSGVAFNPGDGKVSVLISEFLHLTDTATVIDSDYTDGLVNFIAEKYGNFEKISSILKDDSKEDGISLETFISDMDSILHLVKTAGCLSSDQTAKLIDIHQSLSPIYFDLIGSYGSNFSREAYGFLVPSIVKKVLLAKEKSTGKFLRLGVFGNATNNLIIIKDGVSVVNASLARLIPKDKVEILWGKI